MESKRVPKTSPRGFKRGPRGLRTAPRGFKTGPRGFRTAPRGFQEASRWLPNLSGRFKDAFNIEKNLEKTTKTGRRQMITRT